MARTEKVTFPGVYGDRLAARLELPDTAPRASAVFAHCFTCSKDIAAARVIASTLAERGIAVLRFDFTGLGHSDGDFADTNLTSNGRDLLAAIAWMGANILPPSLLVGHSLGGAAVLSVANEAPEVKAVATLGAPADADHVAKAFAANLGVIHETGEAEVTLAGRPFRIKRQFLEDVGAYHLRDRVSHIRAALLFMHAPLDEVVGVENASALFAAAKHPKSFVSLDGADHLLSEARDATYAANVIAAWAERYLRAPAQESSTASQ